MKKAKQNQKARQSYQRLINKTEDYIDQHLSQKITSKELAANANLSEFHFHRIFSNYSHETLHTFIQRTKLERSAIFLTVNPTISLTTIAFDYGYSDSSSYSRAFKKHFGVSPTAFRKRQQDLPSNWSIKL